MPKLVLTPPALRVYKFYGLDFDWQEGQVQAYADCPFCDKSKERRKFSVNVHTSQWQCFSCQSGKIKEGSVSAGGNDVEFVHLLHKHGLQSDNDWKTLAQDRKLYKLESLRDWGIVQSIVTGEWLIPGWHADTRLMTLYRYIRDPTTGRKHLFPSPFGHHLHGVNLYDPDKETTILCEGTWDGVALYEALKLADRDEEANVLATPSATVFSDKWMPLFSDKRVVLMYDSDHPKTHEKTGAEVGLAGYRGMQRVTKLLQAAEKPPKEILYLHWGKGGYDANLPSGYDVRDWLAGAI